MVAPNFLADLCIYILTWNVATKHPKDVSLSRALSINATTCRNSASLQQNVFLPDMYVIGFQEVSTSAVSQIMDTFYDDDWTLKVQEELAIEGYVKVGSEKMQGVVLNVWTLPEHYINIGSIEGEYTRTGFGGFYGNKGAVSIRMSLYGAGVTFLVAHLAAHDDHLQERIGDYNSIVNKHRYKTNNYHRIFDHNVVFWFGDLNFRLVGAESSEEIQRKIEDGGLVELLPYDQLIRVRASGQAFGLLHEELPRFAPTFKFKIGTQKYNSHRRPAWCDRILYRVQDFNYSGILLNVKQINYLSHPEYLNSDHKPVSAEFHMTITSKDDSTTPFALHKHTHGGVGQVRYSAILLPFQLLLCLLYRPLFSRFLFY